MIDRFARTPKPPYYAVVFSSQLRPEDEGYAAMASHMFELARGQPGCLGIEHARDMDGFGLTVAYFTDEAAIAAWKANSEHVAAQKLGREKWYEHYHVRVARVERDYDKTIQ